MERLSEIGVLGRDRNVIPEAKSMPVPFSPASVSSLMANEALTPKAAKRPQERTAYSLKP